MIQEYQLTNPECSILGLLAEGPRYGYQIDQVIEMRGMRAWTEIGFSSIYYILTKLSGMALLSVETEAGSGRPSRRVYRITAEGVQVLRAETRLRLSNPRRHSHDLDLALAHLPILTPEEAVQDLLEHQSRLRSQLDEVRSKWQTDSGDPSFPWQVNELFDHATAILQAEYEWIGHSIQRIQDHIQMASKK